MSTRNFILYIIAQFMLLSCGSHDIDWDEKHVVLDDDEKMYAAEFEEVYGTPMEEGMTWMSTTAASVSVDLSALPEESYTVCVFTDQPYLDNSRSFLLAEYPGMKGKTASLLFDYPYGLSTVYVTAISGKGDCYLAGIGLGDGKDLAVALTENDLYRKYAEQEAMRYTLCFEGYTGGSLDFDYNDLVVEIEYVVGRKEIPVTLRAVGTGCYTQLIYGKGDTTSDEIIFSEAHEALGYPAQYNYSTKRDEYMCLNTGRNDTGKEAYYTLSLGDDAGLSICSIAPKFRMGLKANKDDKEFKYYSIPTKSGYQFTSTLLIAAPSWNYPPEGIWIHVLHFDFQYWVLYPSKYPLWYTKLWEDPPIPC